MDDKQLADQDVNLLDDNYIQISMHQTIIMPFKDGIQAMTALKKAEVVKREWREDEATISGERIKLETVVVPAQTYKEIKLRTLITGETDE